MDDTILLRFNTDTAIPSPISFFANDYESPNMEIEAKKVVFNTTQNGYAAKKVCPAPKAIYKDVKALYGKFSPDKKYGISFTNSVCALLDDAMSHVEIHGDSSGYKLIQKNIYSGARLEIKPSNTAMDLLGVDVPAGFKPIGLRTSDFKALFSFVEMLTFYIQPSNWMYVSDSNNLLQGIISTCLYDELGYIADVKA